MPVHQPVGGHQLLEVARHQVLALEDPLELVRVQRLDHQRVGVLVTAGRDILHVRGRPELRRRYSRLGRHAVRGELVEHGALRTGVADVEDILLGELVPVLEQHLDGVVVAGQQHGAAQFVGLVPQQVAQPPVHLGAGPTGRQAAREPRVGRRRTRPAEQSDVDPGPPQASDDRERRDHVGAGEDRRRELHTPAFTSRSRISVATGTRPSRL